MPNKIEVRISGLGGQGVVLAGQILGRAAVFSGKNAVQTQSYGAEARGSAAKSEVIIADCKIGFPIVRECDVLIVMSQEAANKNVKDLKEEGLLLIDSSTIKSVPETKARTFKIPATATSQRGFHEKLYANVIMLGALVKVTKIVREESVEKAITTMLPKKVAATNIDAYKKGKELIRRDEAHSP